ncbi:MAG: dihydrolipoyl dehydrogenase [Deltaproteobacteria bacterium]|nr:dihydrolipoyl dehydrogenase [Deltaproteobacteria bacterium]
MYDVLILGGGPGGYAAAIRAAQLKGKVALVEATDLGGTCVNRGCIPSKAWSRAAYLKYWIERAEEFGLKTTLQGWDLGTLVQRKNGVGHDIREGMKALLKKNGVDLVSGQGLLKSPKEVSVDGKIFETRNIIIATGSSPSIPLMAGLADLALTAEQVFDLEELPASVLILGGGPIEVETAAILAAFGTKTTLAVPERRILPLEDNGTSQRLTQALKDQGIEIIRGFKAEETIPAGDGIKARLGEKWVEAARVVTGARKPNTAGLGLETIGLKLNDDNSIPVNKRQETSVPGIFAIGDVTGGWMLSHAASTMGVVAAENVMGLEAVYRSQLVPRGLWTNPEMAAVGISEEEAGKQGIDINVGYFPYPVNGLAMVRGQVDGAVKIISEAQYGQILGVHIVGADATELIGEAVMALQLECTVDELAHSIRLHPTFSECLMDASRDAASWALYLPPR